MNMDEAVQNLADEVGRALVVLDPEFSVLAYSVHDKSSDRARLTLALAHGDTGLDRPTLAAHRVGATSGPVCLPADDAFAARTVVPLVYDRHISGYLYFFAPDGSSREAARVMKTVDDAAPVIGMLAALREAERRHDLSRWRALITTVVGSDADARRQAASELVDMGAVDESDSYSVLVFRNPSGTPVSATRLAVDSVLRFVSRSTTVRIAGAVLGEEGVVVFPRRVRPDRLSHTMDAPGVQPVCAGVGGAVDALADAVRSYRQAQLAWRVCVRDRETYGRQAFWDQMGVDRLLAHLPFEHMTPHELPPLVERLVAAPRFAKLAGTLEEYLATGGDAQRAAGRLGINRSTLYYRLDRVRAIVDCDLSDGNVRRDLHVGMRVARLAGLLPGAAV